MIKIILFVAGMSVGGTIGVMLLCLFQIRRINHYESEIRKLQMQLKQKGEEKNE